MKSGKTPLYRMSFRFKGVCAFLNIAGLLLPVFFVFTETAYAATTAIRQEINIIDGYFTASSGNYATTSAIVEIDTNQYTGATYYFEVVASTTGATPAMITLKDAGTYASTTSFWVSGTTATRYRSDAFTPTAGANNYVAVWGNESIGKSAGAIRVVILQSAASIVDTLTQIEIGNEETYTSTGTTTLAAPKYWFYDATKWDGSPSFSAEVTYARTVDASTASSTIYATPGSFSVGIPANIVGDVTVELWGGGGAGGGATANPGAGSGGAGGQYAKSTLSGLAGLNKTLVVAASTAGGTGVGAQGATSTWDGTVVVAGGGAGGGVDAGAAGIGRSAGCVGSVVCNAGGDGGVGVAAGSSGGGGGGAGDTGAGGNASGATAGTGTANNPQGDGGTGSATDGAGASGNTAGGGGAGGKATGNPNRAGGAGGQGYAIISDTVGVSATTTIALQESDGTGDGFQGFSTKVTVVGQGSAGAPTRVRVSFTPVSGRNYRLAFSSGYGGATFAVYNAKIIVDQTSPTKLEAQYLLANTGQTSTGLRDYDTSFDPAEWSGVTNVYLHEIDASTDTADSAKLQRDPNGTPVDVTGSLATGANRATSTLTMTAAAQTIDVSVQNTPIYASRIMVQAALDVTAPTPDPMTFSTAPAADSTSAVSMTASLATDVDSPSIEYLFGFFACVSNGGTGGSDSAWQSGRPYTDSGLQPNQCYGYKTQARDGASTPNKTASSTQAEIYTLANTPGAPTLGSPSGTTLTLNNDENGNPTATPNTKFAVQITSTSPSDNTWLNKYVDVGGNPQASVQWLTDAQLTNLILVGLQPLTTYGAKSMARNEDLFQTASSTLGEGTTGASELPNPRTIRLKGGIRLKGNIRLR